MCALVLARYCDVVANNNELVPRETRKNGMAPEKQTGERDEHQHQALTGPPAANQAEHHLK